MKKLHDLKFKMWMINKRVCFLRLAWKGYSNLWYIFQFNILIITITIIIKKVSLILRFHSFVIRFLNLKLWSLGTANSWLCVLSTVNTSFGECRMSRTQTQLHKPKTEMPQSSKISRTSFKYWWKRSESTTQYSLYVVSNISRNLAGMSSAMVYYTELVP